MLYVLPDIERRTPDTMFEGYSLPRGAKRLNSIMAVHAKRPHSQVVTDQDEET